MDNINPNEAELQKFMASPDSGPVVMVNLLKFKTATEGGESGEAVYSRYMQNAAAFVAGVGGRLLWMGAADQLIIGSEDQKWDKVLLVEYPSRKAFLQMVGNPEFQAAQLDRTAALEATVLLATTTAGGVLAEGS